MKNFSDLLKQAKQIESMAQDMQTRLAALEVTGASGGGLVRVVLGGKGDMRRISVDKSLLNAEEAEVLEDLIVAAHNDAKAKLESEMASEMQKMTGGLPLPPGFKLPF